MLLFKSWRYFLLHKTKTPIGSKPSGCKPFFNQNSRKHTVFLEGGGGAATAASDDDVQPMVQVLYDI